MSIEGIILLATTIVAAVACAVVARALIKKRDECTMLLDQRSLIDVKVAELTQRSDDAVRRAEEADARSRSIEAALRSELMDPTVIGALEAVRIARLWQEHVPGPGEPIPVETPDEVHAALTVLAEVSREDSGTTVEITWNLGDGIAPNVALCIVRLAEELIASAREADVAALDLSDLPGGGIRLTMKTTPPVALSGQLESVLRSTGWVRVLESGELTLEIAG